MPGLLLAAGGGRRAGGPKALRQHPDGRPWLVTAARALLDGGCHEVLVVLGSGAAEARTLLTASGLPQERLRVLVHGGWADGMASSLHRGLEAVPGSSTAVLVHLVDLPDVGPEVVARLLTHACAPGVLVRAAYDGRPGHPVLLGRDHLPGLLPTLGGDAGARGYLDTHRVHLVACGDLATGRDVDGPVAG